MLSLILVLEKSLLHQCIFKSLENVEKKHLNLFSVMKARMKFNKENYCALYLYLKLISSITLSSAMSFSKKKREEVMFFHILNIRTFSPPH